MAQTKTKKKTIKWKKVILCDVKGCTHKMVVQWSPDNTLEFVVKACWKHLHKHDDPNDAFTLYDYTDAKKPKSRKEEFKALGMKVSDTIESGEQVVCSKCKYQGRLLADSVEGVTCPECKAPIVLLADRSKMKYMACPSCKYRGHFAADSLGEVDCPDCNVKLITVIEKKENDRMATKKKTSKKKSSKKKAAARAKAGTTSTASKKTSKKITSKKAALVGKNSGVGIFATWVLQFKLSAKKHVDDAQILTKMKKEFPDRAAKSKVFSNVQTHRRLYNKGLLTDGAKPKAPSQQYE